MHQLSTLYFLSLATSIFPGLVRLPGTNMSLNLGRFLNGYICCECTIFNKTSTPEQGQQASLWNAQGWIFSPSGSHGFSSYCSAVAQHEKSSFSQHFSKRPGCVSTIFLTTGGKLQIAHGLGSAFPRTNKAPNLAVT